MKKILWIDCETSGLDKEKHGIISLAAMMEIDGEVVDRQTFKMNPSTRAISDDALKINGFTLEQIAEFDDWTKVKKDFTAWLGDYIGKFDKTDKATAAGYNVMFDLGFIEDWFKACGDTYLYSWIDRFPLDVYRQVPFLEWSGLGPLENRKLGTVCKAMGVELADAHEAGADIEATRQLAIKIRDTFRKGLPE